MKENPSEKEKRSVPNPEKGSVPNEDEQIILLESELRSIIERAVAAGYAAARRTPEDAYKAVERRLYSRAAILAKLADDRQRVEELEKYASDDKCQERDIMLQRTGVTFKESEVVGTIIADLRVAVAVGEREAEEMSKALKHISGDPYYLSVQGRYELGLTDDQIASQLSCSWHTVQRQRKHLIQYLAVCLYGSVAIRA